MGAVPHRPALPQNGVRAMTDIVFALREAAKLPKSAIAVGTMANAAADEIERLRLNTVAQSELAVLTEKARDMRNAIDALESSLMGLGNLIDLPDIFVDARADLELAIRCNVKQMRRVCTALEECTRIINSSEYNL